MKLPLLIDGDVEVSSDHGSRGTLRARGADLTFELRAIGSRTGARTAALPFLPAFLATGLKLTIVDPQGHELARVGQDVRSTVGRLMTGSDGVSVSPRLLRFRDERL